MKKYRSRLNRSERDLLRCLSSVTLFLRDDWHRRLRNALMVLALQDPGWMSWIEAEIDPARMSMQSITVLVEARAKASIMQRYAWFGRSGAAHLLFYANYYFGDTGNLVQC